MIGLKARVGIACLTIMVGISIAEYRQDKRDLNDLYAEHHGAFSDDTASWFDPSWNNELPTYWKVGNKYYKIRDLMGRKI